MPFKETVGTNHPVVCMLHLKNQMNLWHTLIRIYLMFLVLACVFTVYGPWGRPDMALFKFTKNILNGLPIDVYGHGEHSRDFTYIDDIVEGVVRAMSIKAIGSEKFNQKAPDPSISSAPYKIYNIGSNNPQPLMKYIEVLENCLGIKAKKNMMPMQLGDVKDTYADVTN